MRIDLVSAALFSLFVYVVWRKISYPIQVKGGEMPAKNNNIDSEVTKKLCQRFDAMVGRYQDLYYMPFQDYYAADEKAVGGNGSDSDAGVNILIDNPHAIILYRLNELQNCCDQRFAVILTNNFELVFSLCGGEFHMPSHKLMARVFNNAVADTLVSCRGAGFIEFDEYGVIKRIFIESIDYSAKSSAVINILAVIYFANAAMLASAIEVVRNNKIVAIARKNTLGKVFKKIFDPARQLSFVKNNKAALSETKKTVTKKRKKMLLADHDKISAPMATKKLCVGLFAMAHACEQVSKKDSVLKDKQNCDSEGVSIVVGRA